MNEAIFLSRLATKLLTELQDISDSMCDDEATTHSRSIEAILDAFGDVDAMISRRRPDEKLSDAGDTNLDSDADN